MDNHMPGKVWDETIYQFTYLFPNCNGAAVEVWEWINKLLIQCCGTFWRCSWVWCIYTCDSIRCHYDATQSKYLLWRHTHAIWILKYKIKGRFKTIIHIPWSNRHGVSKEELTKIRSCRVCHCVVFIFRFVAYIASKTKQSRKYCACSTWSLWCKIPCHYLQHNLIRVYSPVRLFNYIYGIRFAMLGDSYILSTLYKLEQHVSLNTLLALVYMCTCMYISTHTEIICIYADIYTHCSTETSVCVFICLYKFVYIYKLISGFS